MDTTSPDYQEKVRVSRKEIVSEIWLDRQPDRETMDVLVTELNHLYGTTDELNWWDNLWGTHVGKAKVKRTVGQLTDLVLQFTRLSKSPASGKSKSVTEIEIPDEPEKSKSQPGKIRNNLRE